MTGKSFLRTSLSVCLFTLINCLNVNAKSGLVATKIKEYQQTNTFQTYRPFETASDKPANGIPEELIEYTLLKKGSDFDRILQLQPQTLRLSIPYGSGSISALLYKTDISPGGLNLQVSDGSKHQPLTSVHYRGILENNPDALVAFSFSENQPMGLIFTSEGNINIGLLEKDSEQRLIAYNDRDLSKKNTFDCDQLQVPGGPDKGNSANNTSNSVASLNCVNWYWETDYDVFVGKGSVANVTSYITGLFNQHAILYANDGISITLQTLFVWSTTDPFTGPSTSNYLTQFGNIRTSFAGDLAHLIGYNGGGGIAWVNGVCASNMKNRQAYSGINSTYNNVPVYSWTVEVVTHEEGHLLGSQHTHDCAWNGNNTPIDGCGPQAGYPVSCTAGPIPVKGTIMSYCHLLASVGIDLSLGFGPQPTSRMLTRVNNGSCLNPCGAPCSTPSQPGNINGSTSYCAGTLQTYSVATVSGATSYNWTLPSGWTGTSTSNSISVTTGATSGTISVTAINSCGASTARTLNVTSNPLPQQPLIINGTTTVCPGTSLTYYTPAASGAISYTWTLPSGWSGSSVTNTITVTAGSNSGNISVISVNNCGSSAARLLAVTVGTAVQQPGAITVSGGAATVCPGQTRTYTTPLQSGVNYTWTVPANAVITSGQGSNSITVSFNTGFVSGSSISVVAQNTCGTSTPRTLAISTTTNPSTPGAMTGATYGLCGMSSVTYAVPLVNGLTYNWSVPAGATIASGQGTNSINVNFPVSNLSGNIAVTATGGCGTSAARTRAVKTIPDKPSGITGPSSVCANSSNNVFTVSLVPSATSYTWAGPSGSQVTAGSTTSSGSNLTTTAATVSFQFKNLNPTFSIYVKANNGCGSGNNAVMTVSRANCRVGDEPGKTEYSMLVYPNPAHEQTTVCLHSETEMNATVVITDMTGKRISATPQKIMFGENKLELSTVGYASGLYLIMIEGMPEFGHARLEIN